MAIVPYVILLGLVGWYLFSRSLLLARRRDYVSLYGEMYVAIFLFLVYGVAGLLILFSTPEERFSQGGVYFSNWDTFLAFLVISLAILCVPFGFRLVYKAKSRRHYVATDVRSLRALHIFMAFVIVFDVCARVYMVNGGLYFSWMAAALAQTGDIVRGGAIVALQQTFETLISAFLAYKSVSSKRWRLASGVFLLMVLLKGQRTALVETFVAYLFTWLYFSQAQGSPLKIVRYAAFFLAVALFSSSIIVDVRTSYRADKQAADASPAQFMSNVVFIYIPQAVFGSSRVPSEATGSQAKLPRTLFWSAGFSSEINRLRLNADFMPFSYFMEALSLPIPSVLYPGEKPVIEQGDRTARWFNLGGHHRVNKFDPGTTVFSDIHKYGGAPMVLILAIILGCSNGLIARYATAKYRAFGVVVFFGMISSITVMANNYATLFVGLRNIFIIFIIIALAHYLSRIKISN